MCMMTKVTSKPALIPITGIIFASRYPVVEELAGIADLPIADQLELSRQVKLLTLPDEMGENFKCIGLSRGELEGVTAFNSADRAHIL